jgi:hypothetical protein
MNNKSLPLDASPPPASAAPVPALLAIIAVMALILRSTQIRVFSCGIR